jgi:hypothetical protein
LRTRIRTRLTYANVVATLALFLVLGGGTALASYVVSSNTQIGPGTVSGHKPPTGKHSNIITGSVNGTDLAGNSVNSSKVTDGSLTGGDLALNSVASALQIRTAYSGDAPGDAPNNFFTKGPWTLTGNCFDDGGGNFHAQISLSNTGHAAMVAVNDGAGQRDASGESTKVAQTGLATSGTSVTASKGGEFSAVLANTTVNNHISGHVLAVADGGAADFSGHTGFCKYAFEGIGQ